MASGKTQIRRSVNYITRLLKEHAEGGYSVSDFCSRHGVSKQTFYNWQHKYGAGARLASAFIPLTPLQKEAPELMPFCDITLPGAASIRFYHALDATFIKALNLY
jgi:hypothetical protein